MSLDQLISELDDEDAAQARRMTGPQKLWAGGELFDDACRWTLAGIREQHPEFTARQALDELRRRIAVADAYNIPESNCSNMTPVPCSSAHFRI